MADAWHLTLDLRVHDSLTPMALLLLLACMQGKPTPPALSEP